MATIVFDADGVLWDGIILYGEEVTLRPAIAEILKELDKRNHRLICCSKNDRTNLLHYLDRHDLSKYFCQVHGSFDVPKSELFKDFYEETEDTLFIDDEPFQRAEVTHVFPQVVAEFYPNPLDLLDHPFVTRTATQEDRRRGLLIQEQEQRKIAQQGYPDAFKDFLKASILRLTLYDPPPPDQQDRLLDLLNRTNELKSTSRRYTSLPPDRLISASLVDRFGDYGIIGVGILDPYVDALILLDLAISCRTQGRGVGTALAIYCCQLAEQAQKSLLVYVEKTGQNWRMGPLFEFLKFTNQGVLWRWTPGESPLSPYPDWLQVEVVMAPSDHKEA